MADLTAPADEKRFVTAALLIIGNEILSGRTKDGNLPYLADSCGANFVARWTVYHVRQLTRTDDDDFHRQ